MRLTAIRLTKTQHVEDAFDGEGARLYGGRWNSVGTRVVYVASSLSLATLELMVHLEDLTIIEWMYSFIQIAFSDTLVARVSGDALPDGWDSPTPIAATQILGDRWIRSGSSALLEVPSAVTTSENNYLINPLHEDWSKVEVGAAQLFRFDRRLG